MANEENGGAGSGQQDRVAMLLGALLIELGQKVQRAGVESVHILTDEDIERDQVLWYRTGWDEHARAADPRRPGAAGHPDTEDFPVPPGRLIRFPDQPSGGIPPEPPLPPRARGYEYGQRPGQEHGQAQQGHGQAQGPPHERPSPFSGGGAGDADVRDLMPHRPRPRRAREHGDER
ncbi:hypothetical protein ACFYYH_06455 [Streptomyces sp. NPDC002018]|uniref:hypothetical protein n=1 Tax=Streptomyces sp. NPDC002018 TaxID=3364629 RepID=UPI00369F94F4